MTETLYYFGHSLSTRGTRIITSNDLIDVMGYLPSMIHEAIVENEIIEAVFSSNYYMHPGFCGKCNGIGKLDWVSSVTTHSHNPFYAEKYSKFFIREEKRVLFYEDQSFPLGHDFTRIFARVKIVDERVESICKHCKGTGIHLDGRKTIFNRMPGLRRRLKEFEWDEKNTPGNST
jgi:hypothetical protein